MRYRVSPQPKLEECNVRGLASAISRFGVGLSLEYQPTRWERFKNLIRDVWDVVTFSRAEKI